MPPSKGYKLLTHEQRMAKVAQAIQMYESGAFNQREIAVKLQVSQPTVCIWLNKAKRGQLQRRQDRIAAKIRDELVCCDVYERFKPLGSEAGRNVAVQHQDHLACFYGEWAARIAESVR